MIQTNKINTTHFRGVNKNNIEVGDKVTYEKWFHICQMVMTGTVVELKTVKQKSRKVCKTELTILKAKVKVSNRTWLVSAPSTKQRDYVWIDVNQLDK